VAEAPLTRRQFMAAALMLLVACCLLDLERLREWWKGIGGRELTAFQLAMQAEMDGAYRAFGEQMGRYLLANQSDSVESTLP
jgi:hypothetical protein